MTFCQCTVSLRIADSTATSRCDQCGGVIMGGGLMVLRDPEPCESDRFWLERNPEPNSRQIRDRDRRRDRTRLQRKARKVNRRAGK